MQVNQPLARIVVDGLPVPGVIGLEVASLGYFSADRFRVAFALGAGAAPQAGFFAALGLQTITIDVATGGAGLVNLLVGQIDNIRVDLLANVATLSGRDLSARLIDTEISETFANQTSSQIALTIAARHGLTPNVTPTPTPVGQYYELDHARSGLGVNARATTEWNLLTWLAMEENFSLSVTGDVLNFGPPAGSVPMSCTPQNFISLTLDSATTIPTAATVTSWNTRSKTVNTKTAGASGGIGTRIIRPNLSAAQAGTFAANHLATLARHATILLGKMPGDLVTFPAAQILLSGTESGFDQAYEVEAVTRSLDARRGFIQTIRAYALAA